MNLKRVLVSVRRYTGCGSLRPLALCVLLLGLMWIPAWGATRASALRFGVLPLQTPVVLARLFIPLCARLATVLHRPVIFATAPDFKRFMARAQAGRYDILFLNPYLYRQLSGYRAVARIKGLPFIGLLIAHKGSGIVALTPRVLKGRTIAFPDRQAFAATLMVKRYLQTRGVNVDTEMHPIYLRSQDSVILAVARGLVDLGGTWPWSLDQEPASVRSRVRVLARTPPGPEMPIVVRDSLSEKTVKALQQALMGLTRSVAGRSLLRRMRIPGGFAIATPADYAAIPRWPISRKMAPVP
ncbi:phosphate/phosphite/phosphonate ABC transporter substrate-binding protein [Acidiferrobacter sp.]